MRKRSPVAPGAPHGRQARIAKGSVERYPASAVQHVSCEDDGVLTQVSLVTLL